MKWVDGERAALAEDFHTYGPDAPTLCTGWTAGHLLAHLVQREHNPIANIRDQISQPVPGEEKGLARLLSNPGYDGLIQRLADGAARWSPMNWAGEQLNLLEFVIHHEELRRGGTDKPSPRDLPAEEGRVIFQRLPFLARLSYRRAPVGVILVSSQGERKTVKKGEHQIELHGDPVELALYISGRQRAAAVDLTGAAADVAAFSSWQQTQERP